MNPYLTAYQEYQKHDRGVSWTDALDYHFQHGAVVATATLFVMARRCDSRDGDEEHLTLSGSEVAEEFLDCWHVWTAAGDLRGLAVLAREHPAEWLTYQRHGQERLRRVSFARLFNPPG